jgi:tRNA G26 N,N-dimethylase Trm1
MNEGKAIINYNPNFLKKLSSKLPVFYNPLMKLNRDFDDNFFKKSGL